MLHESRSRRGPTAPADYVCFYALLLFRFCCFSAFFLIVCFAFLLLSFCLHLFPALKRFFVFVLLIFSRKGTPVEAAKHAVPFAAQLGIAPCSLVSACRAAACRLPQCSTVCTRSATSVHARLERVSALASSSYRGKAGKALAIQAGIQGGGGEPAGLFLRCCLQSWATRPFGRDLAPREARAGQFDWQAGVVCRSNSCC